jgi:hypothetical protein
MEWGRKVPASTLHAWEWLARNVHDLTGASAMRSVGE